MENDDPIAELITTFNELNSTVIDELEEEPSPLEFLRYVARNTPFVARGAAKSWEAFQKWDGDFLTETLANQTVNVAVTPHGNADAPTPLSGGTLTLSKPHEEDQPFDVFLSTIKKQTKQDLSSPSFSSPSPSSPAQARDPAKHQEEKKEEVIYAQTQNDNLRNEYSPLFSLNHLPRSIPFARIALSQLDPDALNLWIGNSRSVTALHRDPYENVYVQLRGRKRFALLAPVCQPCVNERPLRAATYRRGSSSAELDTTNTGGAGAGAADIEAPTITRVGDVSEEKVRDDGNEPGNLHLHLDDGADDTPFATWDPDMPGANATQYSHLARPARVTLEPGDMLYLPAMWYHKVSQFCTPEDEGFVLAVNYWYDMDFSGPLYPMSSFVRNIGLQSQEGRGRGSSGET